jgi:hypothetical protein
MSKRLIAAAAVFSLTLPAAAQRDSCPRPEGGLLNFSSGAIGMTTPLAVNPDGAAGSYTPGDHGYTYVTNGVNLIENGRPTSCGSPNSGRCRRLWLDAEARGFGPGTAEFCVFAMEVEPISASRQRAPCGDGRYVVGNGRGRPRAGRTIPSVAGPPVTAYMSTTSLRHIVGGAPTYLDSATIPVLVAPRSRQDLIGAVAWVRYRGRSTFAIFGDVGPRFGEGSVALHQQLRNGRIGPLQPVGPIPLAQRCSAAEASLQPPFLSKPDVEGDLCGRPGPRRGATDIRAYGGIDGGVETIVLPGVRLAMTGRIVTGEVTVAGMEALAARGGYDRARLGVMADCLAGRRR